MEKEEYNDKVEGRNAVIELLNSNRDVNKIYIQNGEKHGSINKIISIAKEKKIIINKVDKIKMDAISETKRHQGVIAIVAPYNYSTVDDIIEYAHSKNEELFILILDGIEDVHNLGSIIRAAETAGVHGIIIPKRRAASVNATVAKTSAGAIEYMKIARVNNLNETIKKLKEEGLWIIGTEMNAKTKYYDQDLKGPIAIVIGNEGTGISSLVKKNCDILINIPMKGKINSLNASVSTGIILYEALKQRG